jgi:hypothetical protein
MDYAILDREKFANDTKTKLFDKKGITLYKINKEIFELDHLIENNNLVLKQLINLDFVKIMNNLNQDIYDVLEYNIINENEANIVLLMKHFFSDLGLKQKYLNLSINKTEEIGVNGNKIAFHISTRSLERPHIIPPEIELVNIKTMVLTFDIINNHRVFLNCIIHIDNKMFEKTFVEKLIGNIICKVFMRTKQFIENARI